MMVFIKFLGTEKMLQMMNLNLRQYSSFCTHREACFLYLFFVPIWTYIKSYNIHSCFTGLDLRRLVSSQ